MHRSPLAETLEQLLVRKLAQAWLAAVEEGKLRAPRLTPTGERT
jgi:hypothetical protein